MDTQHITAGAPRKPYMLTGDELRASVGADAEDHPEAVEILVCAMAVIRVGAVRVPHAGGVAAEGRWSDGGSRVLTVTEAEEHRAAPLTPARISAHARSDDSDERALFSVVAALIGTDPQVGVLALETSVRGAEALVRTPNGDHLALVVCEG